MRGFTLFETIISVGLLLIIVGSLGGFVLTIQNARQQLSSIPDVDGSARIALSIMSQRIRTATGVNTGASTYGSDPGVLSLEMGQGAVNPTVFRLDMDDGVLVMQEGASSPIELTSDSVSIQSFVVTLLSPAGERENVGIAMTVRSVSDDDSFASYEHALQTSVSLRQ